MNLKSPWRATDRAHRLSDIPLFAAGHDTFVSIPSNTETNCSVTTMCLSEKDSEHSKRASKASSNSSSTMACPSTQDAELAVDDKQAATVSNEEPDSLESSESNLDWKPGRAEWLILICLGICSLVVTLDATILVPALPAIASDLHGNTNEAFWAGTSYLLASAVFQPSINALSDIFGRRILLFIALVLFTTGTIVCCTAQNMTQLLVGRTIQGVGGGGVMCLNVVIATDIVPLRQRPAYTVVVQIGFVIGSVTGPLIGGVFAQYSTWRWVFYVNFPFIGIGLVMVPLVVKLKVDRGSFKERLMTIDWIGNFLFIASSSSFLIGITWGGIDFPWSSWRTLLPIFLGAAGFCGTIVWVKKGAKHSFIRLELFRDVSSVMAYLCVTLQGLLMFCELYCIPLYFGGPKELSLTISGVGLVPITGSLMPVSMLSGILMTRLGQFRWVIWIGWAVTATATGLLIVLDRETKTYAWVLIMFTVGIGHGFIITSTNFAVQALADASNSAFAATMYAFCRSVGMCVGVAVAGTVLQNRLAHELTSKGLPVAIAAEAQKFIGLMKSQSNHLSSELLTSILDAYVQSLRTVFEVLVAVAGLGLFLSLFIKDVTMNRALETDHVLRR